MTMKLVQKDFPKGTREFEVVDDTIYVRIKSLLKEQNITVDLGNLDPEPVVSGSELQFYSRFKGRPVLSLIINKPNADAFNSFVDTLKQMIAGEDDTATSAELVSPETAKSALARNVYEEPPEFVESDEAREEKSFVPVIVDRLDVDIKMMKTYLAEDNFKPLIEALEALRAEPANEAAFLKAKDAYNDLGSYQGAVLTYATYLKILLSDSCW